MFPTDIGARIKSNYAVAGSATAGGAGDGTEVDGVGIDRQDFLSGVISIPVTATLADTETLTFAVTVQESADNSTFTDAGATYNPDNLVLTGDTGGTTETGLIEKDLNLKGLKRYIRLQVTPTLSAATTDTCAYGATVTLGGAVTKPV